jgi:hypothetical protein
MPGSCRTPRRDKINLSEETTLGPARVGEIAGNRFAVPATFGENERLSPHPGRTPEVRR